MGWVEGALWLSQSAPYPQSENSTQLTSQELEVTLTPREATSPTEPNQASPIPDRTEMVLTLSHLEGGKEPSDKGLGT